MIAAAARRRRAEEGDVELLTIVVRVLGADAAKALVAELPIVDAEAAIGWAIQRAELAPHQVRH
jgi:hypothetical protein